MRAQGDQISLGIHAVWLESSLSTQWVAKDPSILHAVRKADAQADLSLSFVHMPFCQFCQALTHIWILLTTPARKFSLQWESNILCKIYVLKEWYIMAL